MRSTSLLDGAGRLAAGLVAAVSMAALTAGAGRAAPAAPDFPASSQEADILRWTGARTSIPRGAILAVDPRAVIALGRKTPADKAGVVAAEVREELIDPDVADKAQARSVLISLELDCSGRRFRILGRTLYGLPDLQGPGRNEAGSQVWTPVEDAAPIGKAWQAACASHFVFPYAVQAQAAPKPKPASPPSGDYQAVLGSYAVPANAQGAADLLSRRFAAALAGRRPSVRTVAVGGKSYAVVTVASFATAADAGAFCGRIRASALVCVVKRKEAERARPGR